MRHINARLVNRLVICLLVVLLTQASTPLFVSAHFPETPLSSSSVIKMAPPAPTFDDNTRLNELAARRARVGKAIGSNGVLILFSTLPRVYTNDVDYEYRQENNLYYLTGLNQQGATLVLAPSNEVTPEILFLRRRSPVTETWTGRMYSPEEAHALSGVKEIWKAGEFEPFMRAFKNRQPYRPSADKILLSSLPAAPRRVGVSNPSSSNHAVAADTSVTSGFEKVFAAADKNDAALYMLVPGNASVEYRQEQQFAAEWMKSASGYVVKTATPIFAEMRLRKSPYELALMQHAIDITIEAHQRAWVAAGEAKWEYEVDAQVAYTFKLRNADHWGYPSIVGCGPNATTLHYQESQGRIKPGELLLMDVGGEYDHYSADVTRTFPVNGKYSTDHAENYP